MPAYVGVFSARVYRPAARPAPRAATLHAQPLVYQGLAYRPPPATSSTPRYATVRRTYKYRPTGTPQAVLALPVVATVGVNAITDTSANLIGSVNPNGQGTDWWFAYGTTEQMTSSTPSQSDVLVFQTKTVTTTLTGLTTGRTYYFAIVGLSNAGTVYGATLSFVSAAPQPPAVASPAAPFGTPQVTTPHFQVPVSMTGLRGLTVVEQNTEEEIFACVQAVLDCPVGAVPELPQFGRPDLTFAQAPLDPSGIVTAIQQQEPRASTTAVSQLLGDGVNWGVRLRVAPTTNTTT